MPWHRVQMNVNLMALSVGAALFPTAMLGMNVPNGMEASQIGTWGRAIRYISVL